MTAPQPGTTGGVVLLRRASDVAWRTLVIAAAVYVAGVVAARLWLVLLPLVVALFVTSVLRPLVDRLTRLAVPRLAALWLVLVLALGVIGGGVFVGARAVYDEADRLREAVEDGWDRLAEALESSSLDLSMDDVRNSATDLLGDSETAVAGRLFSGAIAAVEAVAALLLTLFFTFFFLRDGERLFRAATSWLSPARRDFVEGAASAVWATLSVYIRNQGVMAVINAAQTAIVLTVLGVPLVVPITVVTFIGSFVPFVGPIVAGVAGGLVALATEGPATALTFVAIEIVYEQIEGNVLAPIILGKGLPLHPAVVAAAVTTGALVAGIAGAFLAVPLASALYCVARYHRDHASASGAG